MRHALLPVSLALVGCIAAACGGRSGLLTFDDGGRHGRDSRVDLPPRPDGARSDIRHWMREVGPPDLPCTPVLIEAEDAAQVMRTPGWGVFYGSVLHNGEGLEGNAGAALSWSFVGTGLTVFHGVGPNRGIFEVVVHNAAVKVNTKAKDFNWQVPSVIATSLPYGQHAATLTCLDPICAVDYFLITPCQ
jgi:hypothetical protein